MTSKISFKFLIITWQYDNAHIIGLHALTVVETGAKKEYHSVTATIFLTRIFLDCLRKTVVKIIVFVV